MRTVPYPEGPRPRLISHRGTTPGLVENTLPAFRAALSDGADIVESDIQVTADGVPVLFHDDTLERLTGDVRAIADMTWRDLRDVDVGRGARIPSLDEALRALEGVSFNLDLKSPRSPRFACELVRRLGATERVLFTSFGESRRREAARLLPHALYSASARKFIRILLATKLGWTWLVRLLSRDLFAVQIPVRVARFTTTRPRFIRTLHRAGLEVHFWVVNDADEMRELLSAGADGLITDDVATARWVIDSFNAES